VLATLHLPSHPQRAKRARHTRTQHPWTEHLIGIDRFKVSDQIY
jgi:hypothetical protein